MISLANLTQEKLPLPVRNSQMAADAYLSPLREVFQFLEDVMTVHINVAIGMQATEVVRSSLLLGVGSGLLLGSIAAAVTDRHRVLASGHQRTSCALLNLGCCGRCMLTAGKYRGDRGDCSTVHPALLVAVAVSVCEHGPARVFALAPSSGVCSLH